MSMTPTTSKLRALDQHGLSDGGRALEDTLRGRVTEDDYRLVGSELTFFDIAAFSGKDLAHGSVRVLNTAGLDGDHASAGLESEIGHRLGADGADDGDFVANRLDVFVFVVDLAAGALASCLHAGLAGPEHDDVVAHVADGLHDAAAQSFAEGQQQHQRDHAPTDAEHGEHGAHAIAP